MTEVLTEFDLPPSEGLPPPAARELHIWRVPLDPPVAIVAELGRLLSPHERTRTGRLHSMCHRRRFVVGRAALRQLLGGYLQTPPEAIRFAYGRRGKPRLGGPSGLDVSLRFNLSNSCELALVAVTMGDPVGIDLEAIRPLDDLPFIAECCCSAREYADLIALPEAERHEAFFCCWTRKEAYVKAVGDGLAAGLDRFDVSLHPGEGARLLAFADDPVRATEWSLVHIEPGVGYVGAAAVSSRARGVSGWEWSHGL